MFFRFYILIILSCLSLLPTTLWFGATVIIIWLLFIAITSISRYKQWKSGQKLLFPKTLSFCIKSMKRQKQNFKIIAFLIRNESLQKHLKKLSILMDDINVKATSNFDHNISYVESDHQSPFVYSKAYSDCPENLYH